MLNENSKHTITQTTNGDDNRPIKRIRGGGTVEDENNYLDDMEPPMEDYPEEDYYDIDMENTTTATSTKEEDYTQYFPPSLIKKWQRPSVPQGYTDSDIHFQWTDIDMYGDVETNATNFLPKAGCEERGKNSPVIRLYGVTQEGYSICAHVHGFDPYGYFAVPEGWSVNPKEFDSAVVSLNHMLRKKESDKTVYVKSMVLCREYKSIMGYQSPHTEFLKVEMTMPSYIPALKRLMEGGVRLNCVTQSDKKPWEDGNDGCCFAPFECNIPYVLRYMIDRDIAGGCWITLPNDKFVERGVASGRRKKTTYCQMEMDILYEKVEPHSPNDVQWSRIAPLRVLSMDIECQGRKGHFPEAEQDPVIQIANVLTTYGGESTAPPIQTVFTLNTCLPIVGANVISSEKEEQMLLKWRAFFQCTDPDIITGYNVQNFDIPYLLDRAATLSNKFQKKMDSFYQWGRIHNTPSKMKDSVFESSAYGRRANKETTIPGRVMFDMLPYMQRNHKLSSYTLNYVCTEFLSQQKEDVHHSIISDLQMGSDADRHRLAVYCLKDALLPWKLMHKLSVLVNYVEMARVTGVPLPFLISRGQQIKVFSMILRKCRREGLLVPTLQHGSTVQEDGYEGATVLEPKKKYYTVPIATLDFASLYPSIMQAWNLCYSTLVNPQDVSSLDPSMYDKSDNGYVFVKSNVKKGILPTILEELLAARKRAKKDMKSAPTEFERAVQNGRQLALKVSANSVYGFTGAGVGQLPCLPIASSVTSCGRLLLEKTKAYVEDKFTIANGYPHDAIVIYGDTDSVMVQFGTTTVKDTFPLALEAAEKCSKIFPSPIQLEFEKVYFPYLLMNKKRYAGLMWTNPETHDTMDTKGLETVRRDNCALVREVIQISLDKILIHQDVPGAINYVKSQIADLLQNKMDISRLVITKSLNKGAEYALGGGSGKKDDYKNKQAHVELAFRMRKRDPGTAPQMGDRVPYVIITGAKGAATYERGEDPIYVLENNIPIDCKWYLTNQLSKPLTRIFEPIIDNVENTLLKGEHTRKIFIPTPTARKGSLMMFASKKATCLGCKVVISSGNLCKYCQHKEADIYLEKLKVLRETEERYAKLWARAQRIHGTVHTNIICTGDGCACEFYKRKKVQADMRLALETMQKFG